MDPQKKAIETIDRNVAVNAGAGTGKTKVLTERFVYILENGNLENSKEVESIVAITFTKKATQEMIERIRNEIRKNFHKGDKWVNFYRDMEKSNISTIHSFCGKLLRENPIEAKIDPLFEVLDDTTSKDLLNESIAEAMDLEKHAEVLDFLLMLKEFRTDNLIGDIRNVYNLIRTVGLSLEEVKNITLNFLNSLKVNAEDVDLIIDTIIYLQGKLANSSNLVKLANDPLWLKLRDKTYEEKELFDILDFIKDRMGTSKKEEEKLQTLKLAIDRVLIAKEAMAKPIYTRFLDIMILIDDLYRKKKDKLGGLDYDDLQIMVLELLENKEVLSKYQDKYRYIMIDEFQDTNELQRRIFYKLTTKNKPLDMQNLFVVGDPKQSIYGFRGADIDVFYDVLDDIEGTTGEKPITLSNNYRTVDTVLNFINETFIKLMGDQYDSLNPVNKSENNIDIEILEDSEVETGTEEAIIYESNLIAKRIRQLVDKGVYRYKDFALLFRATTRNFYYEEALKKYNIPYYNSSSKQFFKRQEILDIINAIKTISNPFDTISTIGFLRGPMIGLTDDTIFWLLSNIDINLYNTISKYFDDAFIDLPADEQDKLNNAKLILDYFYSIKDISSISFVLDKLLERTYFIEGHLLMDSGKQAMANIYKFIDMANNYEDLNMQSLEDFIDYIEALREEVESEGVIESEDSDVVKLLTIHKSKGLQFSVVIIPEMARDFMSTHARILFNKDIGIGIKTDENRGIFDLIKTDLDKRQEEERKRVIYVAMTRAKNMLILGNQGKTKGFKKMIQGLLNPNQYKIIDNIDIERSNICPVKLIEEKNSEEYTLTYPLPLLNLKEIANKPFERYSISQFLNFKSCKRSFYLDYFKRLDLEVEYEQDESNEEEAYDGISAIEKGNIIHKFCELYDSDANKEELIKGIAISFGVEVNDCLYNELLIYADNYIEYNGKNKIDMVYKEKPFFLNLGQSYLSGVIDRINISGDEVQIVDFKTNRLIDKTRLVNYYQPQLAFYSYAVEKILKKNVSKATLLFLESGEEAEVDVSSVAKDNVIDEINKFINFVEENSNIEAYAASDHCKEYCKHKNLCSILNRDQIL